MSDTRAYYSPPGTTAVTTDDGGTSTPRAESERETIARLTRERDMYQAEANARLQQIEHLRTAVATAHAAVATERTRDWEYKTQIAGLRLMLREVATTNTAGIDHALRCQQERDTARAEAEEAAAAYNAARRDLSAETATRAALRTQESRIMGILADAGVEVGDVVRGVEVLAARARWSRLWHAEARRLWREVQGLHGMIDDLRGLPQEDP